MYNSFLRAPFRRNRHFYNSDFNQGSFPIPVKDIWSLSEIPKPMNIMNVWIETLLINWRRQMTGDEWWVKIVFVIVANVVNENPFIRIKTTLHGEKSLFVARYFARLWNVETKLQLQSTGNFRHVEKVLNTHEKFLDTYEKF